jgi:hypothetical protein
MPASSIDVNLATDFGGVESDSFGDYGDGSYSSSVMRPTTKNPGNSSLSPSVITSKRGDKFSFESTSGLGWSLDLCDLKIRNLDLERSFIMAARSALELTIQQRAASERREEEERQADADAILEASHNLKPKPLKELNSEETCSVSLAERPLRSPPIRGIA